MFSVYPVSQYFGQGYTCSAYRVDLYTYLSCVRLHSLSKKKIAAYTSTFNRDNSSSMEFAEVLCKKRSRDRLEGLYNIHA
jgi:hypothetical protein